MLHVIVRIGRSVVHGEGWYGKAAGEDHSPEYAVQKEWKACPVVPEWQRQALFAVRGQPRKVGTWLVLVEGDPQFGRAHIGELVWAVVGPCWVLSTPDA